MLKYIADLANKLKTRSTGMDKNAASWSSMPITKAQVDAHILELETIDQEITDAENLLQQKQEIAHNMVEAKKPLLEQIDGLARGIHSANLEKLNEYGIAPRQAPTTRPVPEKAIIASIEDDADAEGFVITIQSLENADYFEIERGVSPSPVTVSLEPPFPFFRTVRKLRFSDNEVEKGKRYFYRIRGANNKGSGAWSETVSRVQ